MGGKLYVVGPLAGPCEEVTLRALRILREVSFIVAQDMAFARELLRQHGICTPLYELSEANCLEAIRKARNGGDVGWLLVRVMDLSGPARRWLDALCREGVELVSVPGASAAMTGLVMSGLPGDRFTFLGLLPKSPQERRSLWQGVAHEHLTVVCEVMADHLSDVLGEVEALPGDRRIALYQNREIWRGQASQVQVPTGVGQFTLIIEGAEGDRTWTEERVRDRVREMLAAGTSPRDVTREVAQRSGWPKRQVYRLVLVVGQGEIRQDPRQEE